MHQLGKLFVCLSLPCLWSVILREANFSGTAYMTQAMFGWENGQADLLDNRRHDVEQLTANKNWHLFFQKVGFSKEDKLSIVTRWFQCFFCLILFPGSFEEMIQFDEDIFQPPLGLDNSRSRRIRDVTSCLPMGPIFPKPQRLKTRWTWALEKQKKTVSRAVRSSRWGLYQLSIVNLRRNSAPNMKRILLQMVGKNYRGTTALGLRKKQTHIIRVVVSNMFLLFTIFHGEMIQFDAFIFFNWVGENPPPSYDTLGGVVARSVSVHCESFFLF